MAACTTKRPVQPSEYIQKHAPDVVWVTYHDNSMVAVADPIVARDTLRGLRHGTSLPVAIPLHNVRSVQAKTPDRTKTAFFVTGIVATLASSVYVIWVQQAGPNTSGVYCGVFEKTRDGGYTGQPLPYC
jgi:hypothetical protein